MRPIYLRIFQMIWCFIIGIVPGYGENYANQFNQPNTIVNTSNINIPPPMNHAETQIETPPQEENKAEADMAKPSTKDDIKTLETCQQRIPDKTEEHKESVVSEDVTVNKEKIE